MDLGIIHGSGINKQITPFILTHSEPFREFDWEGLELLETKDVIFFSGITINNPF